MKHLFILDVDGRNLYHQSFCQGRVIEQDPALTMNFLSAIVQFARSQEGQDVEVVELERDQFVIRRVDDFYLSFQCDLWPDPVFEQTAKSAIDEVLEEFLKRYQSLPPEDRAKFSESSLHGDLFGADFEECLRNVVARQLRRALLLRARAGTG